MNSWKEHSSYNVPVTRARIEEIVRRAKGNLKVLEAGCNEGFVSQALIEAGCQVTSVDSDPTIVKLAKELFNIDVILADVNKLPFSDNTFDLVIGGELLEHLDNPGKGLSELFRVSRDRVIVSLPIGEYFLGCRDHKWQIDGIVIEHDHGDLQKIDKQIVVLEFMKRKK